MGGNKPQGVVEFISIARSSATSPVIINRKEILLDRCRAWGAVVFKIRAPLVSLL